jgi:phosphotransferase system HPr (HPr) family protein
MDAQPSQTGRYISRFPGASPDRRASKGAIEVQSEKPGAPHGRRKIPDRKIRIHNKHGLHLRAAAKWAHLACRFDASIRIRSGGNWANAKSVLNLMNLSVSGGSELEIAAQGQDAEAALQAVRRLEFMEKE